MTEELKADFYIEQQLIQKTKEKRYKHYL